MTEDDILDALIRREGRTYTNHPMDRGGATKFGITLTTLREERGPWVMATDVANLTETDAREIYRRRYIRRPGFDMVTDDRLRALLVDFAVNSGPKRAVLALQRAVGADPDGLIGAQTMEMLEKNDAEAVYKEVLKARMLHYAGIVVSDPSQVLFLRGWLTRLAEFL